MTNFEKIYSILKSKPHNQHHLKRYVRFIQNCLVKNKTEIPSTYMEIHHICPKADDLFPEYRDLSSNLWNSAILTSKQHVLAHVMLMLVYGGSQTIALHFFMSVNGKGSTGNRNIPTSIAIRYAVNAREKFSIFRKGKATFKDSVGNKFFLSTDDPIITELCLVGNNFGYTHTEESKQAMRDTKYPNKNITLYFLDNEIAIKQFSEEFSQYIDQGWSTTKTEDDYKYCKEHGNKQLSDFWTGRARYATPDGIYHGSYLHTDKIVEELSLIPYRTEAQIEQNLSRGILATEAKLGTNIYNNGIEEKFLYEPLDNTWVIGRLTRPEEWESKRVEAMRDKVVGSETWNDGKKNYFFKPGDVIPENMVKGMKFLDNRTYYYISNDKTNTVEFNGNHTPPEGFDRAKIREYEVVKRRMNSKK